MSRAGGPPNARASPAHGAAESGRADLPLKRAAAPAGAPPPDDSAALLKLCCMILEEQARIKSTLALLAAFVGYDAPPADPIERVTVKQAAGTLRVSGTRIRQLVAAGTLAAVKMHGRVLVNAASLAKLSRERNGDGG